MPQAKKARPKAAPTDAAGPIMAQALADAEVVSGELVHVPRDTPNAVYQAMDKADEDLIIAEIAGDLVETMAYEFNVGGKQARGLSIVGVNHAVREMAKRGMGIIRTEGSPLWRDTVDEDGNPVWECEVAAVDTMLGTRAIGLATADKFPKKQNGEAYTDTMAKRKALSKAQRNAKDQLVDQLLKVEILKALTAVQIKRIQTPREQAESSANQAGQQRAQAATAARPKAEVVATSAQVRGIFAAARTAGVEPDGPVFKAIHAWVGGVKHVDRLPKKYVDRVLEALADADGTLSLISAAAQEPAAPDHRTATAIMAWAFPPEGGGDPAADGVEAKAQAAMQGELVV